MNIPDQQRRPAAARHRLINIRVNERELQWLRKLARKRNITVTQLLLSGAEKVEGVDAKTADAR